jgi:hypothetical protein
MSKGVFEPREYMRWKRTARHVSSQEVSLRYSFFHRLPLRFLKMQARRNFTFTFTCILRKCKDLESSSITMPTGAALMSIKNAGADGQAESDGDKAGPAHAAIMLAAYVIIFPLGALLLRFLESVKTHYVVQTIRLLVTIIGVGIGLYLSTMYNQVSSWLLAPYLSLMLARTVKRHLFRTSSLRACTLSLVVCAIGHRFLPSSTLPKVQTDDNLWQVAFICWSNPCFGTHRQWVHWIQPQ